MSASVTVVVPARNRPGALRRCLTSLGRVHAVTPLEIVVVDDGSEDVVAVQAAVAAAGARLVRQEHCGVAAARNRGALAAQTPFVCFVDDDCVADPDWIERLRSRLADGADVVAGPTFTVDPGERLAAAAQVVANAFAPNGRASRTRQFLPASNFGCRTDVLRAVPFDERYAGIGAEDRDWYERIGAVGYRTAVARDAVVFHFPELGAAEFVRKSVRYGRGGYRYRRRYRRGRLERPGFYVMLIRRGFREGLLTGLLVVAAQIATAAGYASEAWRDVTRKQGSPA